MVENSPFTTDSIKVNLDLDKQSLNLDKDGKLIPENEKGEPAEKPAYVVTGKSDSDGKFFEIKEVKKMDGPSGKPTVLDLSDKGQPFLINIESGTIIFDKEATTTLNELRKDVDAKALAQGAADKAKELGAGIAGMLGEAKDRAQGLAHDIVKLPKEITDNIKATLAKLDHSDQKSTEQPTPKPVTPIASKPPEETPTNVNNNVTTKNDKNKPDEPNLLIAFITAIVSMFTGLFESLQKMFTQSEPHTQNSPAIKTPEKPTELTTSPDQKKEHPKDTPHPTTDLAKAGAAVTAIGTVVAGPLVGAGLSALLNKSSDKSHSTDTAHAEHGGDIKLEDLAKNMANFLAEAGKAGLNVIDTTVTKLGKGNAPLPPAPQVEGRGK